MAGSVVEEEEEEETEMIEDSVISEFDHIYTEVEKGKREIELLKSELNRHFIHSQHSNYLSQENQRLTKLYTGSLNKLAHQIGSHTKCQSLQNEVERIKDEHITKQNEYKHTIELIKQDSEGNIKDLENQIRGFLIQKATDEATIKQLQGDMAVQKNHIDSVTKRLKRVRYDDESRYQHEIQDLKDCLSIEQEEKNELNKKLLNLEKELLMSRNKLAEQQRDLTSNYHTETLKLKIMKLRKENEVLKRNLQDSKQG